MSKLSDWQPTHTREKLQLYKLYLKIYLSILTVSQKVGSAPIWVIDCFAGEGINRRGEKGSPVIAAEAIKERLGKLKEQGKQVPIRLFVNELDKKKITSLREKLEGYKSFTECSDHDANVFLKNWIQNRRAQIRLPYTFLFIDPYGYTDISDFRTLFSQDQCDYLMFIPISHIYRFLRKENEDDEYEENEKERSKPVMEFLQKLSIDEITAIQSSNIDEFAEHIRKALVDISGKKFCYCHKLNVKDANSKHGLFFLSGHHLGGEKFLEIVEKIQKRKGMQMKFEFLEESEIVAIVEGILKGEQDKFSNTDLYIEGLKKGLLAPQVSRALKKLRNSGKIEIFDRDKETKINSPYFYIGRKYYDDKDIRIYVRHLGGFDF